MPKSRGKKFESEIAQMLRAHPAVAYVHHAPDLLGTKFTLPNPIDFLCYLKGGHGLVVECKVTKTKRLPFARFVSNQERLNGERYGRQWRALDRCAQAGVETIVLVNAYGWPGRDGQRGAVYVVPFCVLADLREKYAGVRKSWPLTAFQVSPLKELEKVTGTWEWEQSRLTY